VPQLGPCFVQFAAVKLTHAEGTGFIAVGEDGGVAVADSLDPASAVGAYEEVSRSLSCGPSEAPAWLATGQDASVPADLDFFCNLGGEGGSSDDESRSDVSWDPIDLSGFNNSAFDPIW
jgi:hypothetical protein